MARFSGKVGFALNQETSPGVYKDIITEHSYYGDVIRNSRSTEDGDKVNDDVTVNVSISIMANAFALLNYSAIKYVNWEGTLWKVAERTPERPRITLRLGGLYNGRTPSPSNIVGGNSGE